MHRLTIDIAQFKALKSTVGIHFFVQIQSEQQKDTDLLRFPWLCPLFVTGSSAVTPHDTTSCIRGLTCQKSLTCFVRAFGQTFLQLPLSSHMGGGTNISRSLSVKI